MDTWKTSINVMFSYDDLKNAKWFSIKFKLIYIFPAVPTLY